MLRIPRVRRTGEHGARRRVTRAVAAAARRSRYLISAASLALLVGALAWVVPLVQVVHEREGMARPLASNPARVAVAVARQGSMPVQLEALGTVTPLHTVSLTSQVNGQVLAVHYDEGQFVHRGDLLIEIDPRPFQATLLSAQGTLARDRAELAQARMDLDRYRAAWARNAISKQQLDDQEKQVEQARGAVSNDLGAVQFDQTQLDFCRITSPLDGRIGLRLVDPGNVLSAAGGTTLAVITQVTPISVVFNVSENDLADVLQQTRAGKSLTVLALDRTRAKTLGHGTLGALDNQIDTTTGTVRARALFDNGDEALFPNQFVNVRLLVRTIEGAVTLPTSALQHDGNDTFVYALQDQRAHVQRVQPGVIEGDTVQVEGIAPGTVVANGSFDKLREGVLVTADTSTPAGTKAAPQ